jgi:hypothetical protein
MTYPLLQALRKDPDGVEAVQPFGDPPCTSPPKQGPGPHPMQQRLDANKALRTPRWRPIEPGIEDLFMHLMQ